MDDRIDDASDALIARLMAEDALNSHQYENYECAGDEGGYDDDPDYCHVKKKKKPAGMSRNRTWPACLTYLWKQ
jgi:hypothetical protein